MKLTPGDKVAVIAPSGYTNPDYLRAGIEVLNSWGLNVQEGKHLFGRSGYFSGTIQERLTDLEEAIYDPSVKAVFCARGGYGASHLVDLIDWKKFQGNFKWLIGFSDITEFHLALNKLQLPSIHGIMVVQMGKEDHEISVSLLKELLFEGTLRFPDLIPSDFPLNEEIVGGNLRIIIDSLCTPNEIETQNKVLFMEEIGEHIYKIDRMLVHLKRSGKLDFVKGVIAGQFSDIGDTTPSYGLHVYELIEKWAVENNLPLISNFPAGHDTPNYPLVLGLKPQHISRNSTGYSLQYL